jgi:hypothetical protein
MDIQYIKDKIFHLDEYKKIQLGEKISSEVIDILRQGSTTDRSACFVLPGRYKTAHLYESEITCSICDTPTTRSLTKTNLLSYLNGDKVILCDACESAKQKEKENEASTRNVEKQKLNEEIEKNTNEYITKYLNPHNQLDDDTSPKEQIGQIMYALVNYSKITKHIKSMDYHDFLQTPYWMAISSYKKNLSHYKCALCGSNKKLATHHKTYSRHGQEHLKSVMNEDLIVLCDNCHKKFHDSLATT